MKYIFFIISVVLTVSCQRENKQIKHIKKSKEKLVEKEVKSKYNNIKEEYPLVIDTLKIDSQKFIVIQNDPRDYRRMNLSILDNKNDTIYVHDGFATNGFEFEDFDANGILDIRLLQITNVGGISELISYDKLQKKFKPVKNFENFPEPKRIKKTNYWISYHKSGCADINWGSELFTIRNFEAIKLGEIEGLGCEGEKENGIFVYKTRNESRVKMYSEKRKPGYYSDKWDFIEKYWNKNYLSFE